KCVTFLMFFLLTIEPEHLESSKTEDSQVLNSKPYICLGDDTQVTIQRCRE
ncbi:Hypothetical predicted protein, partial [Podarcis lilfordi]